MFSVNLFCFLSLEDLEQLQGQDQLIKIPVFSMAANSVERM